MSEYQYYEFRAIDKPLTDKDRQSLRSLSTRARITSTSFVNEYHWGDFKGDPLKLMEKYFDVFLYFANWGTHWFMLRIPKKLIDIELAKKYCVGESAKIHEKNDYLIFEFLTETEDYEYYEEEASQLSSLISLRSDIIRGDYRCLYLAWLLCVQESEVEQDSFEPPVPANLNKLNASLKKFAEFMKINPDLIEVVAENSISEEKTQSEYEKLKSWITTLPENEKNEIIFQLISENEQHLGTILMQRFQESIFKKNSSQPNFKPRKVYKLLEEAEAITEEREQRIKAQKAAEKARQIKEAKEKREKHLYNLAKQEDKAWKKVNTLIETKKPTNYDEAVQLLVDLKEINIKQHKSGKFKTELQKIYEKHSKKPSFIERLKSSGLSR